MWPKSGRSHNMRNCIAKTDRFLGGFGTRDLRSRLELDVAADGLFGASQSFRANTASVEEISGRRLRL